MTEPVTLKMLKIASTNGQLCDRAVHKQGGGVSKRKRLHKGHCSCLTVSTIIPQQRTCTAAPLQWAWMAFVTGGGLHRLTLAASTRQYRCEGRCKMAHYIVWHIVQRRVEERKWKGWRKGALQFQTVSFHAPPPPPRWTSLTLQGLYVVSDLSFSLWDDISQVWKRWEDREHMMGHNHWKYIRMGTVWIFS